MKTPTEYLRDFVSCTPPSRAAFADDVISQVNDGHTDPIVVLSAIRNLKDILEMIDAGIKDTVLSELDKHSGKLEAYGMKIERKEVGTKYFYDRTNDSIYSGLSNRLKQMEADLKDREKWLKSIPATGIDIVTEDGEVIKIHPPLKTSTTSFAVTLNK